MSGPLLVLVGPMGVGKSTVGQLLAQRLGVAYRDTDDDIVAAQGRTIADIFVDEGEPVFRAIEKRAVHAPAAARPGRDFGRPRPEPSRERPVESASPWLTSTTPRPPRCFPRQSRHSPRT
ncbi:Shikimate kinase [Streptomyces sp. enrichment culture]